MVISGTIHYKDYKINFEVKQNKENINEENVNNEEIKQPLIHAINQKYRVKYPQSSTIDSLRVSTI
ncbi:hypothetical protein Q7A53_11190 [Halobacillus rhizosphaerae]|uniref:hypothetical protein n=1 Tax=Halobacillus rhizosphaerae TaxID=3064889 RepID=UPI00398B665B